LWKIEAPLENRKGILHIGGANTMELAERYGTPLYVTDEGRIRNNIRRLIKAFKPNYDNFKLKYAIKANNNLSILRIIRSEGAGADASCQEEIQLAKMSGFNTNDISYTGNYNSNDELKFAYDSGAIINLDDATLLAKLLKFGVPETISFRINPGVGKGKYSGLVFGGGRTKFGITVQDAIRGYSAAKKAGVKSFGIHMMTGSCVMEVDYFREITEKLIQIAGQIKNEVGIKFDFFNVGGGFGIPYQPGEDDLDIRAVGRKVCQAFRKGIQRYHLGEPELMIEPGRYVVGDSTVLLARVHHIKRGARTYIGTDAGMNTLLRPALYKAYHQVFAANKLNAKANKRVNICGQICENTDVIAEDREMPEVREGDLLAILNAGAYGFAMSSQYNSRPRAAEVLVNDGKAEIIRERETVSDFITRQRKPARLK
jgi:diaminopimelate decarboxylase